jgi:hypothetical protein
MTRRVTLLKLAALLVVTSVFPFAAGCVHSSGGTWMVRSAATPDGWPELTPIGEVQVKTYPTYREAVVTEAELPDAGMQPMFMTLFRHIQDEDIAMTAPVDMGYATTESGASRMASMAFLYRTADTGAPGRNGNVRVRDLEPRTFASVGVRGDYTDERFAEGLRQLETWTEAHRDAWHVDGQPRYLGYNGPFVPSFMRYGEVQVPVRPVLTSSSSR